MRVAAAGSTTLLLPRFRWQLTTTLIVGAASDVAIAACICERLVGMRGQGFRETDRVLDRLVAFTVGEIAPWVWIREVVALTLMALVQRQGS